MGPRRIRKLIGNPFEHLYDIGARLESVLIKRKLPTMSAKSLGTLAMIYATDKLQNPLPLKTMLCEGDMNNPVRRSDAFLYN